MSRESISVYLNSWIADYVLLDDNASQPVKAKYPLREARVDVIGSEVERFRVEPRQWLLVEALAQLRLPPHRDVHHSVCHAAGRNLLLRLQHRHRLAQLLRLRDRDIAVGLLVPRDDEAQDTRHGDQASDRGVHRCPPVEHCNGV